MPQTPLIREGIFLVNPERKDEGGSDFEYTFLSYEILKRLNPSAIAYSQETKEMNNANIGPVFSYKHTFPMILTIVGVPMSKKITGMLFNDKQDFRVGSVSKIEKPLSSTFFLPNNHIEVQDLFVYKDDQSTTYVYNPENNSITFSDYSANSNYTIFYTYKNAAKMS
jgi:hypothetical protein